MTWFANLKISAKLISAFVLVAMIAGIIGTVGSVNLNNLNKMETEMYDGSLKRVGFMGRWLENFHAMRTAVRDIYISDDRNYQLERAADTENYLKQMDQYIADFQARVETEEGQRLLDDLTNRMVDYRPLIDQAIEHALNDRRAEAGALIYGTLLNQSAGINNAAIALMDRQLQLAETMDIDYTRTADNATLLMIALAIGGMALAILLGIVISRMISRPVQTLVEASNKIADGDMNVTIDIQTKDEIGELAKAFQTMTDNMNEVLQNIANASEQVASGSRQVSEASQSLSQGSTEQASSIQQLTASMDQIAAQTKQNARSAEEANDLAMSASADAEQGNAQMKGMLTAMEEINESSGSISKIIKVIDEIAFQTNILALNAAVEAARAGQHGKGFAVVAEEVRNLAARSANAAKETTVLIEGSIKKVEAGTRIANDTAQALEKIVAGVNQAAELVGSIANASNEQAAGITQVNQGIAQVSDVIQANSATSEECAAASEELSGQSEQLKEMVSRFRLKRGTAGSYRSSEAYASASLNGARHASTYAAAEPAATAPGKVRIQLDDADFGKYE